MSPLRASVAANFLGNLWPALMSLAFIPPYIRCLGIEAFGLVGFFTTLLGIFALLDMGLSSAINREMARLSAHSGNAREMRNLARTLEVVYWAMAILIGSGVVALAPVISTHWLNASSLPPETVRFAIMIMGLAMVFRWPYAFYAGGLMGLQRQLSLNLAKICIETLRAVGAILVLWYVSPTVVAFFAWQILVYLVNIIVLGCLFWHEMPSSHIKPIFQWRCLKEIWGFAAGLTGISVLTTILGQFDKVLLSRMLPLKEYGYYMLATSLSTGLNQLISPIFSAVYPRFTHLRAIDDQKQLTRLYHISCQVASVAIWPVVMIIAFFSREILQLWTRSPETAEYSYKILRLLVVGTGINGMMYVPYALQLAHGWLTLTFYWCAAAVIIQVPLLVYLTTHFGAVGASFAWVLLFVGQFIFYMFFLHRQLLQGHLALWYLEDVGKPALIAFLVATFLRWVYSLCENFSIPGIWLFLAMAYVVSLFCCVLSFEFSRKVTRELFDWLWTK